MAATTTLAVSAASAGYSAYQSSKKPVTPALPTLPPVGGDPAIATSQAGTASAQADIAKKRRAASGTSSTLLTGPQGVQAPAPVAKTLLGS